MRLLNTRSLRIEEFTAANAPEYAILSHTWGKAEATFADWSRRLTRLRKSTTAGFAKILSTCKQARQDGLSYVWIDTVCIDKSSSAELSEAINSMFSWYEKANVCYVYLDDVSSQPLGRSDEIDLLKKSRWFTRGWTLQELIAPDHVLFFSNDWVMLGTKKALSSSISEKTGIDRLCLSKEKRLHEYSIAQRMSWAANRQTTREEDIAYSLLGMFNINMPLLYGEGKNAFRRLQEEITKASDDHSIFTFNTAESDNSLLAHHPSLFRDTGRIQPRFESRITPPFHFNNAGLSLTTPLIHTLSPFWVLAVLNCYEIENRDGGRLVQICLPLLGKGNTYMRGRDPVCLVRKPLRETKKDLRHQVQDLTTRTTTSYLVTYFTRIYEAYGPDLDPVMKGFEDDDVQKAGFMLTFPRGLAGYRVVAAYPQGALQEQISIFAPPFGASNQSFSHGLIVFEEQLDGLNTETNTRTSTRMSTSTSTDASVNTSMLEMPRIPKRIGVHLAQTDDFVSCDWMCRLIPDPNEDFYETCSLSRAFEADTETWEHYDQLDNCIVAARTQLLYHRRPRQVVLVEVVFDADVLFQEIYDARHIQYFKNGGLRPLS
ncbi:heterokaryon incompatibility protein-domain-containing protein [Nemania sp. FL0916]|nr:heterokaryon incompatibility protein-domain-containing protein [Nemania sp. FL0916]